VCYTYLNKNRLEFGGEIMKELEIKLTNISDVRAFVNEVMLVEYEVDLVQGRYVIDAKSIMGIFALDLLSPITVKAYSDFPNDFFEKIKKFAV
jgi:hypothetical protein